MGAPRNGHPPRARGLARPALGLAVWQWQDPITLVLNKRAQSELASEYAVRVEREQPRLRPRPLTKKEAPAPSQAALAAAYRKRTEQGEPIGRLTVPRMDLSIMVVYGTETDTLKKGPGLHESTGFPGQKFLTYVAGHRTTYGAPFSDIDKLQPGDRITFEVPYGTYRYQVVGHRIVRDDQIEVLKDVAVRSSRSRPAGRAFSRAIATSRTRSSSVWTRRRQRHPDGSN